VGDANEVNLVNISPERDVLMSDGCSENGILMEQVWEVDRFVNNPSFRAA
jgi:hypothetical protein